MCRPLFCVLVVALYFFIPFATYAEDDHGDDQTSATVVIPDDAEYEGTIEDADDVDCFTFDGTENYRYTFLFDSNYIFDVNLNANVEIIDKDESYLSYYREIKLADPGTVYICISAGDNTEINPETGVVGTYNFNINAASLIDICSEDCAYEDWNCISNNCMIVNDFGDSKCVPADATGDFECEPEGENSGGCFIRSASSNNKKAFIQPDNKIM